jgi:hypothetical protein
MFNVGRGAGDLYSLAATLGIPMDRPTLLKQYYKCEKFIGEHVEQQTAKLMAGNVERYLSEVSINIIAREHREEGKIARAALGDIDPEDKSHLEGDPYYIFKEVDGKR